MNKFRKFMLTILPILIVIASVGGFIAWSNGSEKFQPENPLLKEADPSHMLLTSGGNLSVSQDLLGDESDQKGKNGADESDKESSSIENEESSSQNVKDKNQQAIENYISENYYKTNQSDDFVNESDANGNVGSDLFGNAENNPNNVSVDSENSAEKTLDFSGDSQQDILNDDEKDYFTTTIKDGETVKSRDYSFEIKHNYPELKVKSVDVSVNKVKQIQFNGSVLLEGGENVIRIAVKYVDSKGKVISVAKRYIVNVDLGEIKIETSLSDFSTRERSVQFGATATFDNKPIDLTVTCNGNDIVEAGGRYDADLNYGENVIILSARYGELESSKEFHIICTADKPVSIETNLLEEQIVHSEDFQFSANILDGSGNGTLTAYINSKRITDKNGNEYHCSLKIGTNIIRIKATDKVNGNKTVLNKTYVVKYVPMATDETTPYIESINISDGMTVKGTDFTLNILARDYLGEKIYQKGISVTLNGVVYPYTWASRFISYRLWLENGANKVDIRITDKDGRYADFSYIINCNSVADGEKIGTITFSLDANVLGLGYLIEPMEIEIHQGENMAELIGRILEENGFIYSYDNTFDEGFYLSRISKSGIAENISIPSDLVEAINKNGLEWNSNKFNDSLGEHDYCQGSGWMYSVNGDFPNFSMSDCAPKDKDVIKVRYTLAYGRDIGGAEATGTVGGGNYDKVW